MFIYFYCSNKDKKCYLSDSNLGLSGALDEHIENLDYYELKSKSLRCENSFVCSNGKCLSNSTVSLLSISILKTIKTIIRDVYALFIIALNYIFMLVYLYIKLYLHANLWKVLEIESV